MNILIDTHIALWAITDTKSLTERMKTILEDEGNTIYYSIASVWEIAIKHKLHPDQFSISEEEFDSLCRKTEFHQLGIKNEHIYTIKTLVYPENAPKHNDPFDRLLLSQAKAEQLLFLTHDKKLSYYNEKCVLLLGSSNGEKYILEEIINNYSGDKLIPELFLIDYLQDYEGMDITSACTSVSLFFGYYYIQKGIVDISIPKAVKELSKFFDYLSEKGYIDRDGCAEAKEQMKRRTPEWVQQEKDWETMDYDEYNEKYWGLIF